MTNKIHYGGKLQTPFNIPLKMKDYGVHSLTVVYDSLQSRFLCYEYGRNDIFIDYWISSIPVDIETMEDRKNFNSIEFIQSLFPKELQMIIKNYIWFDKTEHFPIDFDKYLEKIGFEVAKEEIEEE